MINTCIVTLQVRWSVDAPDEKTSEPVTPERQSQLNALRMSGVEVEVFVKPSTHAPRIALSPESGVTPTPTI